MSTFNGRVALVTGGGSGLGEAIGRALAAKGAKVVLTDINLESAERIAGEIVDAGGVARAIQQDTAKAEDSEKVVNFAVTTFGALHYAVNSAGIGGAQAPAGETDLADWQRVIDINLSGVLYGMRAIRSPLCSIRERLGAPSSTWPRFTVRSRRSATAPTPPPSTGSSG